MTNLEKNWKEKSTVLDYYSGKINIKNGGDGRNRICMCRPIHNHLLVIRHNWLELARYGFDTSRASCPRKVIKILGSLLSNKQVKVTCGGTNPSKFALWSHQSSNQSLSKMLISTHFLSKYLLTNCLLGIFTNISKKTFLNSYHMLIFQRNTYFQIYSKEQVLLKKVF